MSFLRNALSTQRSLLLMLSGFALIPLVSGFYYLNVITFALIMVILAISLSIVTGLAGQVSMGQAAFITIGGYASALISTRLGASFWVALPLSGLIAAAAGLVIGLPSLRARGIFLSFITLMFSLIVWTVTLNWDALTGGTYGIYGIPRPSLLGFQFDSYISYYYLTLLFTVLITWAALKLARSSLGLSMMSVRDDEYVARMMGFNTHKIKLLAFVISALFAGMAGSLYAHYVERISPESFPPSLSLYVLMMICIGGMYRIEGAIIGGLLVSILPEILRFTHEYWNLFFGVLLVITVIKYPGGIINQAVLSIKNGYATGKQGRQLYDAGWHPNSKSMSPKPGNISSGKKDRTFSLQNVASPHPTRSLLEVRGISHTFGEILALDNVSLTVSAGSIFGIIGPNGAGKSLMLNIITGFVIPQSGQVIFRGEKITRKSPSHIATLGLARTFQEPRIFNSLTVMQNVVIAGQTKALFPNCLSLFSRAESQTPKLNREKAEALIEEVGLQGVMHESGDHLSYGQKKLLALACALHTGARLILLDEPASGINPKLMDHIMELIAIYCCNHKRTFLIIEHRMKMIIGLCSNVLVLNQGRCLTQGTPEQLQLDSQVLDAYFGT